MLTITEVRSPEEAPEIRTALLREQHLNPALRRLKGRVLADAEASEVITSYDRMHHRHNRS
jgi:hypothetical protein